MVMVRELLVGGMIMTCTLAMAGEIIILEPSAGTSRESVHRKAQDMSDRARLQAGQAVPEKVYVLDANGNLIVPEALSPAERLRNSAREHLDTTGEAGAAPSLRAAPISESERLRLKARGYLSDANKPASSKCGNVGNEVGMIGDGPGAQKSESVIERGGESVNLNCR